MISNPWHDREKFFFFTHEFVPNAIFNHEIMILD